MGLLKGKRALITGGTSGLGKQIALTFAEEGADVAILGTNLERAKQVVETLEEFRTSPEQRFWFDTVNVGKKEEVNPSVEHLLKEWEGVDILVNCAGITRDKLFMKMSEDDWDQVIETNLKSVYNLSHALVRPMMKARQGKIINITSVIGLTGNPGQVNYSASKLGIVGLTRSLAKELGPRNVNVNCIAPGFFETPMTDALTDEQKEAILKKVPMGRLGNPKEIAHAAVFLASDRSNYITGQVLTVDGGMIA
ncbi:3-oxoacyl-ACP reductase FabG [Candidatus Neptunochlamydia vexilliferae]|uniref:3-oxoacyl-[acyl-carrier-protein] reductase n=1 Tax=Candidatus Neptunichlamydia vexilliferae TaxID=1651774 RepID=A0ABS0B191_9BACT|nr:3-oxoacyl-ACP reductase FabG [Candidatus Neptunochlamydia vexilliferae]MBF5059617.1 3-oxoacyl-[acyl-carrier-protein] reductase FabG [Candidatus Neptunochlamydia vexilliferae]